MYKDNKQQLVRAPNTIHLEIVSGKNSTWKCERTIKSIDLSDNLISACGHKCYHISSETLTPTQQPTQQSSTCITSALDNHQVYSIPWGHTHTDCLYPIWLFSCTSKKGSFCWQYPPVMWNFLILYRWRCHKIALWNLIHVCIFYQPWLLPIVVIVATFYPDSLTFVLFLYA